MPMLDWIGKDKVINHHNDVPYRVLDRQYSYDSNGQTVEDNDSQNMIIQGDNLEALKSLLPRYEGKIKCIYIDPPYNTGNENWIYNDNVNSPQMQKWLGKVVGTEEKDLTRHDKWLCMMYPRLKLLHKLLADDGVIFISIDDNEQANLKYICDEIFGKQNYVTLLIWKKKKGGSNDSKYVAVEHEYVVMYGKKLSELNKIFIKYDNDYTSRYKEEDEKGKYFWDTFKRKSGKQYYPIYCPDGTILENDENGEPISWLRSEQRFLSDLEEGEVKLLKINNKWTVHFKQRMPVGYKPRSIITENGTTSEGANDLKLIFSKNNVFDNPKPVSLISFLLKFKSDENMIILDSFAGSGTTAHAVLNLNKEDGGNRKFILIEMLDYAENITAERVKRVIKGYGEGKKAVDGTGGNFSFYKLGEQLLIDDELNENLPLDTIRKYIWFTETRTDYVQPDNENPYFLGDLFNTDYYFYYEKDRLTTLNKDFLATLNRVNDEYLIYADICTLSDEQLLRYNITFKKIPRDITKF